MKTCTKCHQNKELSEFYVKDSKSGRLHAQCKNCYKIHRSTFYKEHYAKYHEKYIYRAKLRRIKLREEYRGNLLGYLSNKACEFCGESDPCVLEFDHIHRDQKSFSISQGVKLSYSWDEIYVEINKCRILCSNCHKKRTAEQFNWYKK